MNVSVVRMFVSTAVAGFLGLGSAFAAQVTVHLPVAAHWGNAVIQPGQYRVTLPQSGIETPAFYVAGATTGMYALASKASFVPQGDKSYLKLVNVNGEYYVQEYVSGSSGKSFTFITPKPKYKQKMEEQVVPVGGAGTN